MPNRTTLLREQINFLKEHDPNNKDIEKLEKSLNYSKRGRSSKQKGANYERKIVKFLEEKFPNLKFGRTPSSGGYKKDIDNLHKFRRLKCNSSHGKRYFGPMGYLSENQYRTEQTNSQCCV